MMCKKPYRQGVAEFGCGQCTPCRINRRRVWTARLMLEAQCHESSAMVTLTYAPEYLPEELVPRDLTLFLKRLRRRLEPQKVRYFACGEYGDISGRAHFHIIVFGLGGLVVGRHGIRCACVVCRSWKKGICHIGEVNAKSAAYCVSYVLKGLTKRKEGEKHPEFARMSLGSRKSGLGGIGSPAVKEIARVVNTKAGAKHVAEIGSVPSVVRSEGTKWPLGRYLLRRVSDAAGYVRDAGELQPGFIEYLKELQLELREPGARDYREQLRQQHARRAYRLKQISQSKKGIGL